MESATSDPEGAWLSRFADALDQAVAVVEVAPGGGLSIVHANAVFADFVGRRREALIGSDLLALYGDSKKAALEALRAGLAAGRAATAEVAGRRPDGRAFRGSLRLSPLSKVGGGCWLAVQALALERFAAQQGLAGGLGALSDHLVEALEFSPNAAAIFDADDRLVLFNEPYRDDILSAAADLLEPGVRFEKVVRAMAERGGRTLAAGRIEAWIAKRVAQQREPSGAVEFQLADGRWMRRSDRKTGDGNTLSVYVDISELRAREAALERSEQRFETAFRANPGMIVICGLDDAKVRDANARWLETIGRSRQQVLGRGMIELGVWRDAADFERLAELTARDGRARDVEAEFRTANGASMCVLVSADRIELEGEAQMLIAAYDISARKRLEGQLLGAKEQAELANRTKTEFLANISHELRTPLNAIIGFADMVASQSLGPLGHASYGEYVEAIGTSGLALLELINDILEVSRLETGSGEIRESTFDLVQTTASAADFIYQRAVNAEVALEVRPAEPAVWMRGDETKVRQVIINLLANAAKFTPAGGRAVVRAGLDDGSGPFVSIEDNGIGIADEDVAAAFELFGQADASLSRKYDGAGLGLYLSKALVELHGGSLELQSEPGQGTTVTARFPASRIVAG